MSLRNKLAYFYGSRISRLESIAHSCSDIFYENVSNLLMQAFPKWSRKFFVGEFALTNTEKSGKKTFCKLVWYFCSSDLGKIFYFFFVLKYLQFYSWACEHGQSSSFIQTFRCSSDMETLYLEHWMIGDN